MIKRQLSSQLGINICENNISYLGNPLFLKKNKIREFNNILDKMVAKTDGWKAK